MLSPFGDVTQLEYLAFSFQFIYAGFSVDNTEQYTTEQSELSCPDICCPLCDFGCVTTVVQ